MIRKVFLAGCALIGASVASAQVQINQIDTFNDLGNAFWNSGAPFQVVGTGGPDGTNDAYLSVTGSGTTGVGSVPSIFNQLQWTGNWLTAGVKAVTVDLKNFGPNVLRVRCVFHSVNGTRWTSTNGVDLAVNSPWTRATFIVRESDFTRVLLNESFNTTIGSVNQFQFRNDDGGPSQGGAPANANLGIDNVAALDHVPVSPVTSQMTFGVILGGTVNSLKKSDNSFIAFYNTEFNTDSSWVLSGTSAIANPTGLRFIYECFVSRPNVVINVELFKHSVSDWEQIEIVPMPETEAISTVIISSGAANFVNQSTRQVSARFSVFPIESYLDAPEWTHFFDFVKWEFLP